jgi:hypothetical protein
MYFILFLVIEETRRMGMLAYFNIVIQVIRTKTEGNVPLARVVRFESNIGV